jgi:hypothetical protein
MRSVLIVSYAFPPQYDVSARRAAKLCKYLPAAGWRPVVLTKDWTHHLAPEDRRAFVVTSHPDALDEIADVPVVRTAYHTRDNALRRLHQRLGGAYASNNGQRPATGAATHAAWSPYTLTRRALSLIAPTFGDFPDAFAGWVDDAVPAGVELAQQESVDAICSLCPPATAHVVAAEISRRTGIPWVPQFDDLFSFDLTQTRRLAWRWHARWKNRRRLRAATVAGAITPAMLDYLRRTYGLDGDVVMVGFDPDEARPARHSPRTRMRLVYTGSVYLDDHRPELLFDAVERVLSARSGEPCIEVVFAGTRCDDDLRRRLAPFRLASQVCRFIERLSPEESLELQRDADILVLFNYTAISGSTGTLSFPAKTFEYLNARRPILALPRDPGGWGDELLATTGAGATADSAEAAAVLLTQWLDAWRATGLVPYAGNSEVIARYGQPRQAAVLGGLLDRALAATGGPRKIRAQGLR